MKFYLWETAKGMWRWTAVAANGRKIANNGQGHPRKETAERGIIKFKADAAKARVVNKRPGKAKAKA